MEVEEEKLHHDDEDNEDNNHGEEAGDVEEEAPSPLSCGSTVLDVSFHPKFALLCCALVSSELEIYKPRQAQSPASKENDFVKVACITGLHRGESCRTIGFNFEGTCLFTGGGDGSLHAIDSTQGTVIWTSLKAHDQVAVNRVSTALSADLGPYCMLSGDEDGTIKLWDIREKPNSAKFSLPKSHVDFVTDFAYEEAAKRVMSTGGDGTLTVFDLRKPSKVKVDAKSEQCETEFLSLLIVKNGKRVLCGTQEGPISVFSWGSWEYPSDSITGHPHSVDCLLKVDENTILTGSSDGIIRVVKVHPNKLLGVIGFHDDFPVERMQWSHDRRVVGTCSHDNVVRFWETGFLVDGAHRLTEMDIESSVRQDSDDDSDDEAIMHDSSDENKKVKEQSNKKKRSKISAEKKKKPFFRGFVNSDLCF